MARKKLALTDEQVEEIVHAINAAQGLSYYQLASGAIAKPALAPIAERFDAICADVREAKRVSYRREWSNTATSYRDGSVRDRQRELRIEASGIVLLLGHQYPAIQGDAYECSACGATGRAEENLNGAIFRERCK